SRRRHTRFSRDWSSDVCSSDLSDLRRVALSKSDLALGVLSGRLSLLVQLSLSGLNLGGDLIPHRPKLSDLLVLRRINEVRDPLVVVGSKRLVLIGASVSGLSGLRVLSNEFRREQRHLSHPFLWNGLNVIYPRGIDN